MRRLLWAASCAVFLLLLSSLFRLPDVPTPVSATLFAFTLFATYRPAPALLAVAALVPIATWTGRQWNGSVAWPETIAIAYLAGYAARKAIEHGREPADTLVYAIHGMIAVIAASVGVELLVLHTTLGTESFRQFLGHFVSIEYFLGDSGFASGDAAMRLLECLLLAHAGAALAKTSSSFGPRLVRAVVAGAVMAGALNLWRLWLGAARGDDAVVTFLKLIATLRFNTHYADVNAAGSYYVMALLPALALTLTNVRWAVAAATLALSIALTGSRAAVIAGPVALGIVWFRTRQARMDRAPAPHRWLWRATATLLLLACTGLLYAAIVRNVTPVTRALEYRKEFALTGLRMAASRPLFGVGIGDYRTASGAFSSERLRAVYPNENAHNNFLQILAEVGVIGFVVFAVLLVISARRTDRLLSAEPSAVPAGAAAGLLAFLVTCVAGHPLLIDEPALSFWLLLGTVAGWGSGTSTNGGWKGTASVRRVAFVLLVVVAVSVPLRARREFGGANLEHQGIGLSRWQVDADGARYRIAGPTSTVFVPADASVITIPLRSLQPQSVLEVQVYLDGRHANTVRIPSDQWRVVPVAIPQRRDGRRFRAHELKVVTEQTSGSALLMIGKVAPH